MTMLKFLRMSFTSALLILSTFPNQAQPHPFNLVGPVNEIKKIEPFYIQMKSDFFFGPKTGSIAPVYQKERNGFIKTLLGAKDSYPKTQAIHKPFKGLSWIPAGTIYRVVDIEPLGQQAGMESAELKLAKLDGDTPNFTLRVGFDGNFKPTENLKHSLYVETKKCASRNRAFAPVFRLVSKPPAKRANPTKKGNIVGVPKLSKISMLKGSKVRFKETIRGDIHIDALVSITPDKIKELNVKGGQVFTIRDYSWNEESGVTLTLENTLGVENDDFVLAIRTYHIKVPHDPTKTRLKLNDAEWAVEKIIRLVNSGKLRLSYYPIEIIP